MQRSLLMTGMFSVMGLVAQVAAQQPGPAIRFAQPPSELRPQTSPFQAALEGEQPPFRDESDDLGDAESIDVPPQLIPPPDPPPPRWGALDAPAPQPLFQERDYEMVGPSRGISPTEGTSVYQRRVRDPNTLVDEDYRLNAPIDLDRPDGLAPAGVFGDHTLKNSRFLISWRYNATAFNGNLNGTQPVSPAAILAAFPFAPLRETFQQNLILMEYAPTDDLTMMIRLPIQEMDIEYLGRSGQQLRTTKTDLGDIPITLMYALRRWNGQQIHLNFGVSIPTGIIDTLGDPFVFTSPNLSYWQRPSSTTWDLLPGLTYTGQTERWTWGAQTLGTVRLGIGRYHYRLGDQVNLTAWLARRWMRGVSTSARLNGLIATNGRGADPNIDPNLTPTNRINLMGGQRLDLLFGLNYQFPDLPRLPGSRLAIEPGFPIYQSLDGPQLRVRWLLNASWNVIW